MKEQIYFYKRAENHKAKETKLFYFHRIFNSKEGGGGANPLWNCHCNALPITY